MTKRIAILLTDDHQMVIDGLNSLLLYDPVYTVVATANNGREAYERIAADPGSIQLVLTDISMPQLSGTQLCRRIKDEFPHIQVLILSMYDTISAVKEAVIAEADGYLLKSAGRTELMHALHRIANGGTYFSQDILPIIYGQYHKEKKQEEELRQLSAREREVLSLIVREFTSEEIGEKLFISKKTVGHHRQRLLEKTGCRSTVGLVKFAIRNGVE